MKPTLILKVEVQNGINAEGLMLFKVNDACCLIEYVMPEGGPNDFWLYSDTNMVPTNGMDLMFGLRTSPRSWVPSASMES
jgi:hypothetical protein